MRRRVGSGAGLASLALLLCGSRAAAQEASPDSAPVRPIDDTPAPTNGEPAKATPADAAPAAPVRPESEDVTIVGARVSKTAGSVHVLGRRQLERFEYDDPQAVLGAVPGVYARGEDGVGLRPNIGMRGVNPDRSKKTTLMEDGVLFGPAPYSAPAAYYFPLITRMTQVRVIKGAGSIVYGPQTIGGALDLITRPIPTAPSGMLDAAAGEYGYNKLHGAVGTGDEKIGFLAEGVHLGNSGFKSLPSGADTGFYRNELMFKARYVLDPSARVRNELTAKFTYSDEVSNETYVGLSDADFRANPLQRYSSSQLDRMAWHRTAVVFTHVVRPTSDLSIATTAYRNDYSRTWRKVNRFGGASVFHVLADASNPRNALFAELLRGRGESVTPGETLFVGPNARDFVSQGIQTVVRWDGATGPLAHRLEYGIRLHYDRIERRHGEDGFRVVGGELAPTGAPTVVTAYNEASTQALALHATDALTWGRLTLTPGVRIEAIRSMFTDKAARASQSQLTQVFIPGAGAYFGITGAVGALAGVHRGFSPPTPGIGPRSSPELSVNYEGGFRFTPGRARAEVIGFYNDYSNLTDVCTLSSGCVEANLDRQFDAGKARIYGVEAYVEHDVRLGSLKAPVTAAYTITRANFIRAFKSEDPIFGNVFAGDEIPYVPRHQLNVSLGLEGERAGGALAMTYVSAMREQAGIAPLSEVMSTDEQFVLDASAHVKVAGPLMLYVNVRNVLDARYIVSRRPYGARPNAPRWVQVGAKIHF